MASIGIDERAPNRVPKGTVRLSEAFELLYRRVTPDWDTLENLCAQSDEDPDFDGSAHEDPYRLTFEAMSGAEVAFREALLKGDLRAFIHNTETGVDFELPRTGWLRYGDQVGIHSDYTDTKTPGPDCTIDGVPHPIFLPCVDFERWLARWGGPAAVRPTAGAAPPKGAPKTTPQMALASRAYSVDETIQRTGLSKTTLYEAIADRKLRARKYGVRTLILETDLDVFLKSLPAANLG